MIIKKTKNKKQKTIQTAFSLTSWSLPIYGYWQFEKTTCLAKQPVKCHSLKTDWFLFSNIKGKKKTNCVCYTFLLKVLSWYSHGISDFNPMELVFCWGFFPNADNFNFSYCCKQNLLSITEGFCCCCCCCCCWTIHTTRCHSEGKARENSRVHLRSPCWSQFFWETPVYVQ